MARPDLFSFDTLQGFLKAMLKHLGRGSQNKLAETMHCQPGYLTRILQGSSGLSLEQAERARHFFNMGEDEQRYFFNLVEKDRAGTEALRVYFERELNLMREKRNNLKERYQVKHEISNEAVLAYYNDWKKIAVHSAAVLPGHQTPELIAKRLRIEVSQVRDCLDFLARNGFMRAENGKYIDTCRIS